MDDRRVLHDHGGGLVLQGATLVRVELKNSLLRTQSEMSRKTSIAIDILLKVAPGTNRDDAEQTFDFFTEKVFDRAAPDAGSRCSGVHGVAVLRPVPVA